MYEELFEKKKTSNLVPINLTIEDSNTFSSEKSLKKILIYDNIKFKISENINKTFSNSICPRYTTIIQRPI